MDDKEDKYTIRQILIKRNIGLLDLLGVSFIIFKTQFKAFFVIVLLLGIPLNISQILYPMPNINMSDLQSLKMDKNMLIVACHFILNIMLSSLQISATIFIVKKSIINRQADASSAIKFAIKKFPKVFITYILYIISILLGAAMFVLPGLIISILFMLSLYVSAARNEYGISALKYAFLMAKKNTLKITYTFLFTTLFQLSFTVVFGSYVVNTQEYFVLNNISYYLSMYILVGYLTTLSSALFYHFEYNYGKPMSL